MRHIVLITPTTPHRGGIAQFGTLLARHLVTQHYLITWGFRRLYPDWLFPGSTAPDPSKDTITCTVDHWLDGINPYSWWRAWRTLSAVNVIIWQWWTPFWIPLLFFITWQARRNGIATVAICHQLVEPDAPQWQARIAVWALRRADAVLFLGVAPNNWPTPYRCIELPTLHSFMSSSYSSRHDARHRLGIETTTPIVLFFGFIRDYKGLDTIIHAMALSHIPYHLIIAGEWWPLRIDIHQLITDYNLMHRIHIYNEYIPNEQVSLYFMAADVVVLPYRSGTVSGVAGLAHHFGIPIMTSTVGALAGSVPPISRLPAQDVAAWRRALDDFFCEHTPQSPSTHDGWAYCMSALDTLCDEITS